MAISNVHAAAQQVLEGLDPRFQVLTEYKEGRSHYTFKPKQAVPFTITFSQAAGSDWKKQLTELFEHGMPAKLSAMGVEFKGSPLFDAALPKVGTLVLEPYGKKAVLKLSLVDEATSATVQLDDIHGELAVGRSSITFTGSGLGNLLKFTIRKNFNEDQTATFRFGVELESWVGIDVRVLPYFDSLYRLYAKLAGGWALDTRIEVQGTPTLAGKIELPHEAVEVSTTLNYLRYTQRARVLASHLNQLILFQLEFSTPDHIDLAHMVDMIEGKHKNGAIEPGSKITCRLTPGDNDDALNELLRREHIQMLLFDEAADTKLTVFNQSVRLPKRRTTLNRVNAKVLEENTDENGARYLMIEWVPQEGFTCSRELLQPDEEAPSTFEGAETELSITDPPRAP